MKKMILSIRNFLFFMLIILTTNSCLSNEKKLILIITGGHDFEEEAFLKMFQAFEGIEYQLAVQPLANNVYSSDSIGQYDALVFYDMVQDISEAQKKAFIGMLEEGKGLVFLHHSLTSYQNWPEFLSIMGGKYLLKPIENDGLIISPASDYNHDMEIPVKVVDKNHPVTKGISDFVIHDETYGKTKTISSIHPLLITHHPSN
ncbi:MAG: ThuA domain-containing protein, partial [Bacteroidales bacterium]|nr:ThuA domain-containing protein [Bacteroidales bacterium]